MAVIPYMPFYVADYMADTQHLSTLEHGAYILLIMAYWQHGKPLRISSGRSRSVGTEGQRPFNDRLASVARLSNEDWAHVEPVIREFFTEKDGFWHHKRIDAELDKFRLKSDQARAAGLASAQRRSNGRSTDVPTVVERTLNQSDRDRDADRESDSGFDDLSSKNLSEMATITPDAMREALHGYMGSTQWDPPDEKIVEKAIQSCHGASMKLVGSLLMEKYKNGFEPRMAKGPKSYAWFPAVFESTFGRKRA